MRWRGVAVVTNTPPRSQQRSPGPMQANAIMEPVVTKAARRLGLDQLAIRRINSPEGKALYGAPRANGQRPHVTSASVKQALDRTPSCSTGTSASHDPGSARVRKYAAWEWPSGRTERDRSGTT